MSSPDLTRMVGMSTVEAQDQRVETEVLEPASCTQSSCKFLLPQKGLLSADAFLKFKMIGGNANMDTALMAGSLGVLRRASMYYGNVLLCDTDQAAHLLQLKSTFVSQDVRNQTYQTKIGHFSGLKVDESAAGKKGMYSLDAENDGSGIEGLEVTDAAGAHYNRTTAFRLGTTAANTPEWSIPLKWLFPSFLTQTQLPLGLLNDRITVVFDFNDDLPGMRTIINTPPNVGAAWVAGNDIVIESVQMSLDLIYYDDLPNKPSRMEQIASALNNGIEMVYTDYVHVEEYIPAQAAQPTVPVEENKIIRLQLDHQIVRNLLMATPLQADYSGTIPSDFANPILGDYCSPISQGETSLQVKINNQNLYVNAINSDAKLWNELSQVYNTPAKSNVGFTSMVGQVAGANLNFSPSFLAFPNDKHILGHPEGGVTANSFGLSGQLGYMGVNMSRTYDNVLGAGTSVGKAPVEIIYNRQRTNEEYGQVRVLVWAECERIMMIRNGTIYVSGG